MSIRCKNPANDDKKQPQVSLHIIHFINLVVQASCYFVCAQPRASLGSGGCSFIPPFCNIHCICPFECTPSPTRSTPSNETLHACLHIYFVCENTSIQCLCKGYDNPTHFSMIYIKFKLLKSQVLKTYSGCFLSSCIAQATRGQFTVETEDMQYSHKVQCLACSLQFSFQSIQILDP